MEYKTALSGWYVAIRQETVTHIQTCNIPLITTTCLYARQLFHLHYYVYSGAYEAAEHLNLDALLTMTPLLLIILSLCCFSVLCVCTHTHMCTHAHAHAHTHTHTHTHAHTMHTHTHTHTHTHMHTPCTHTHAHTHAHTHTRAHAQCRRLIQVLISYSPLLSVMEWRSSVSADSPLTT